MELLLEAEIRQKAKSHCDSAGLSLEHMLFRKASGYPAQSEVCDIFICHDFSDEAILLGIWLLLEDLKLKVGVDWQVGGGPLCNHYMNPRNANLLRHRILLSKALFVVTTTTKSLPKFLLWPLGLKDGHNGRAAFLPIAQLPGERFAKRGFQNLYPYASKNAYSSGSRLDIYISTPENGGYPDSVKLMDWLGGSDPSGSC